MYTEPFWKFCFFSLSLPFSPLSSPPFPSLSFSSLPFPSYLLPPSPLISSLLPLLSPPSFPSYLLPPSHTHRENDLLREQLKKHVGMLQAHRKESSAKLTESLVSSTQSMLWDIWHSQLEINTSFAGMRLIHRN